MCLIIAVFYLSLSVAFLNVIPFPVCCFNPPCDVVVLILFKRAWWDGGPSVGAWVSRCPGREVSLGAFPQGTELFPTQGHDSLLVVSTVWKYEKAGVTGSVVPKTGRQGSSRPVATVMSPTGARGSGKGAGCSKPTQPPFCVKTWLRDTGPLPSGACQRRDLLILLCHNPERRNYVLYVPIPPASVSHSLTASCHLTNYAIISHCLDDCSVLALLLE